VEQSAERADGSVKAMKILKLAVVTMVVGCAGAVPDSGSVVRDSAGVTIVESTVPLWQSGEEWHVSTTPSIAIGETQGADEYQLFRVVGACRLADGRIVVANWGSQELRFYDEHGRYLYAAGKEGGGPGEFRSLGRMFLLGDSLVVVDFQLLRVSLFATSGEFIHSFNLTSTSGGLLPIPEQVFSDGKLLVQHDRRRRVRESGLIRDTVLLATYTLNGEFSDSIGWFPEEETYFLVDDDRIASQPRPFGLEGQKHVAGDRLYFGASDSYEIRVSTEEGVLERSIRRPVANPVLSSEEAREYQDRLLERLPEMSPPFRELHRQVELPATKPAYSRIIVDSGGNLWVAEYPSDDSEMSLWNVFDPEGRWLGTVGTPYGGFVYQIGDDFLLGVWINELDVEQLRVYSINKPGAGGSRYQR
jgi:hypothetical protein